MVEGGLARGHAPAASGLGWHCILLGMSSAVAGDSASARNPVCSGVARRALSLIRSTFTPLKRIPPWGEVPPQMAYVSTQDLLQELDCLTTKAGQACVQHESDQRDDGVHVGPGERQGGRWTEAGEWGALLSPVAWPSPPASATCHVSPEQALQPPGRGAECPSRLSTRALVPQPETQPWFLAPGGSAAVAQGALTPPCTPGGMTGSDRLWVGGQVTPHTAGGLWPHDTETRTASLGMQPGWQVLRPG